MKTKISITIDERLLKEVDDFIDNAYVKNRSQAFEELIKKAIVEDKAAVILCGGDESLLQIGKEEYAPLVKVGKYPLIEHQVRKLAENGFKKIYIVARKKILSFIMPLLRDGSSFDVSAEYIEEISSYGTFDSLKLVKEKLRTKFIVVYGDIFFDNINLKALWEKHLEVSPTVTLMVTTSNTPSKKGVVIMEGDKILEFIQKPKKSDTYTVFSPIFAANSDIFRYGGVSLEYDVFPRLAKDGKLKGFLSSEREIHINAKEDVTSSPR